MSCLERFSLRKSCSNMLSHLGVAPGIIEKFLHHWVPVTVHILISECFYSPTGQLSMPTTQTI